MRADPEEATVTTPVTLARRAALQLPATVAAEEAAMPFRVIPILHLDLPGRDGEA
jgi:hypothetical protein